MLFKSLVIFFVTFSTYCASGVKTKNTSEKPPLIIELTDDKWDQIQKGQWLIAFFDRETEESKQLEENWQVFALKCREQNINVGKVIAPSNPGLYVRFLVTVFPKVFYIKNGVAHEVSKPSKENLIDLIRNEKWNKLKTVNFLSNPFSVQMSLLSHLFVHAVNLYNFENSIVQKFISAPSATDIAFGLTFIIVGTFLGLLLTCAFGVLQIFFMDSKDSEENVADDKKSSDGEEDKEEEKEVEDSSEKSSAVRKRK